MHRLFTQTLRYMHSSLTQDLNVRQKFNIWFILLAPFPIAMCHISHSKVRERKKIIKYFLKISLISQISVQSMQHVCITPYCCVSCGFFLLLSDWSVTREITDWYTIYKIRTDVFQWWSITFGRLYHLSLGAVLWQQIFHLD